MSEFNVFISYKATDNGLATPDAAIAEELYRVLSLNEGVVPFLDQRELVNQGGRSDFGNSIYTALDSARIFIFICSKAEYLTTSYVESEWTTYLNELNGGRKPRGSIFGITQNVDRTEIPIGLRKFEILSYSSENIQAISAFISRQLRSSPAGGQSSAIQIWKQERRERLLSKLLITDLSARQFLDEFLAQKEKRLACISLTAEYDNNTMLAAEAVRLMRDYDLLFFDTFDEAEQILRTAGPALSEQGEGAEALLFVDRLFSPRDAAALNRLIAMFPGRIVIQTRGRAPAPKAAQVVQTRIFPPDEHELISILKSLCREKEISGTDRLIEELMLPVNKGLRKPSLMRVLIEYLMDCGSELLEEGTLPLFEIMDSAITELCRDEPAFIDELVHKYLLKRIDGFSIGEITGAKNLVPVLEKEGLVESRAGCFSFLWKEYLPYKTAETLLVEQGKAGVSSLLEQKLFDCAAYCFYALAEQYGILCEDLPMDRLPSEQKRKLIVLFIKSAHLPAVVRLIDDESLLADTLSGFTSEGLYSLVHDALTCLEASDPQVAEKAWAKVLHMTVDYYLTGVFRDCGCRELINYWINKGTIAYCLDDYPAAVEAFDTALTQTDDEQTICRILMLFSDVLADSGNTAHLRELLQRYQTVFRRLTDSAHYAIYRGGISFNQAELLDAKEYFIEALRKQQRSYHASIIARICGNIGLTEYYLGNTDSALSQFKKNEDICIDTDNAHGIAISRVYIGQAHLFQGRYDKAFAYFSSALFYASKVQNQWRITQIRILIDQFYPDFDRRIDTHVKAIEDIKSPIYHAEMYLLLAECMLRANCPRERILSILERGAREAADLSRLRAALIDYYSRLLRGEEASVDIPCLENYCAKARELCSAYDAGRKASIQLPADRLPFVYYQELESEDLEFRHISKADAVAIYSYSSRIQPTKYVLWERHESVFVTLTYIEELLRQETQDDDYMVWVIVEKKSRNVIGTVDLSYEEDYQGVEIGIILSDLYWRKHYGSQAMDRICRFAGSVLHLPRIYGVCVKGNWASEQMMRKNGFRFVKRIPDYHNIAFLPDRDGLMFVKELPQTDPASP